MDNIVKKQMEDVLSNAFLEYAGYNLQRRAIPDVRDGLKWGARQLLHAQMLGGFTYNKPFKKAMKSVSQAMGFSYVHGDASAYGTFIRMAKPFAYRVPLQEAKGNYGTMINPDDHSQSRYVELRGSEAAAILLKDLNKDTITEWEDTYDLEGKFPKVLPAKGFWGGVNGCISIGSGMSSSLPPLNLKETNEAMIKLLWNPDISDDEIICLPDFPTGALLLNKSEVIESLKAGTGAACKIRSVVEWDSKEQVLCVKQMPYSTYTNTICIELADLIENDENCPIKDFVDYTGDNPDLRISLKKNTTPERALKYLYKNTSLQTFFSINMTVLDNGVTPCVMGQRELFNAHLAHEKKVYTRGFQFDLNKIQSRIHIIEALLKAYDAIDEVILTIKTSANTKEANLALQKLLEIDEVQAKAILDLKLSRLSKLDITKLTEEYEALEKEKGRIEAILSDENLLKKEIENGLREVAEKFGDERRTKILDLAAEGEEEIEKISLQISLTNKNNIYVTKVSSLFSQKRGGAGTKIKLDKDEFVIDSVNAETSDSCLAFTTNGNYYTCKVSDFAIEEKTSLYSYCELKENEIICAIAPYNEDSLDRCIVFVTKNGLIKKSEFSEYSTNRRQAVKALNLDEGDEIVSILFSKNGEVGILTKDGFFVIINISNVRAIGRVARGVKGIGLRDSDYVISAKLKPNNVNEVASISSGGLVKKTPISEFPIQGRGTKGQKIQKLTDGEIAADFLFLSPSDSEVSVCSSNSCIKIRTYEIPVSSRGAQGVKAIKLKPGAKVIKILS